MNRFKSALAAASMACFAQAAQADEAVMIVFDGSNSMWGQIEGVAKIEIARGVMENLLGTWTEERAVGLMAYGHRRRGDCTDIETLIAPATGTRAEILSRINAITPTGKTPLTDAVEQAARAMSYEDTPATVILISDGLESCERDPCALAEALEKGGVGFTAHVVGFGLGTAEDAAQLSCIAEQTGGQYLSADNADELGAALSAVSTAVAAAPAPEPEPEPAPEPVLPQVTVTGPQSVIKGSIFEVQWTPTIEQNDYITIVPMGAEEGTLANYEIVRDNDTETLRAPAEVGLYELRYVSREGRVTLGTAPIEVTGPEVTISGPQSVVTGARFDLNWTGKVANDDYITIVPMGAEEGTLANYEIVRDNDSETLTAPAETGLYELRYVLREGRKTLASQPIEVTDPEVTISGPQSVVTGARFDLSWTGKVANDDYITIVPMGAEEGTLANYEIVRDNDSETLTAPAETGLYELRYVLRQGRKTLASQPIEVTEASVELDAPDQVRLGDELTVKWSNTINEQDYITIAPMGSADDTFGDYDIARNDSEVTLKLPETEGMYELRYILREGRAVIARRMVEVLPADAALNTGATLTAPASGAAGAVIEVGFEANAESADQRITLAQADQAIFTWISAVKVEGGGPVQITLPSEPGTYELRFLDVSNQAVLARQVITVN